MRISGAGADLIEGSAISLGPRKVARAEIERQKETKVTTDLLLAIAHHLLIFALVAVLAAETVLVRPGLTGNALARLGGIDRASTAWSPV